MIQYLNKENFADTIEKDGVVLVDFYADWCGPCQAIHPVLEELSNELGSSATVAKVNVDQEQELAGAFNIRSIPTMIVFKNGKAEDGIVGIAPKSELRKRIDAQLAHNN